MKPHVVLILPLVLMLVMLVATSGCTIPGTDIEIPGIPDIFGTGSTEYTNDIIIIKSLSATPGTSVSSGQTLTLTAAIQNIQDPELSGGQGVNGVSVELYDYCTNLFTVTKTPETDNIDLAPQEIKILSWKLEPSDVKLITPCELKVKVTYGHDTDTVTSITFIDEDELNNRIQTGAPYRVTGTTTRGYGPVKAALVVETEQPVPSNTDASVSMTIENVGRGYVKDSRVIKVDTSGLDADGELRPVGCEFNDNQYRMIQKKTTPIFCKIDAKSVDVEQTFDMKMNVKYEYEFRKSLAVRVEPL